MFEMVLTVKGKQLRLVETDTCLKLYEHNISLSHGLEPPVVKNKWYRLLDAFSDVECIFEEVIVNETGFDSDFSLRCSFSVLEYDEEEKYFQFNLQKVADGWFIFSAFSTLNFKIHEIEYAKFKYYWSAYHYFMYTFRDYVEFFYLFYKEEVL